MTPFVCLLMLTLSQMPQDAVDQWGLCTASPAVVHPVLSSPFQSVITLRGTWDFVTDPQLMGRHRMGKGPGWNEPDWSGARTIDVPGCWEAQGVGEPGMSKVWDLPFDCIPRPLNHVFMGTARYRRKVEIPADWTGKRVWLKVGGVRTEAWFWVNQQRVAHLNAYCGTYKYDITGYVKPGESMEIVATVRNDTPSRKGCMAAFHRFGGFYRDIEIEATPQTYLDDVWVRSDIDTGAALVNINVRTPGGAAMPELTLKGVITTLDGVAAGVFELPLTLDSSGNAELMQAVRLNPCRLWSPEDPALYIAEVTLLSQGAPVHGWRERFGLRKLEVRGEQFYLNGNPYFLRGYGDDAIYPATLVTPADKETHLAHLQIARAAGFNFVRHHTHCEIPEFFEAADEAGILIQPELPYYHDITTEGFVFDPQRDIEELYRHYRRYVSFAAYSLGNEGYLGSPLDESLYAWAKKTDPDRIFQHQDGGCNTRENADFFTPNGYGLATSIVPWEPGTFDGLGVPFVAHEYLNLGIKLDPRLAPQFTGAIPAPRPLDGYEASLRAAGLDRTWGDACLDAAQSLQAYYQKRGIEQARRDPACDGYSYWTIVDVMVPQGSTYTGQGFLDAFWQKKPGGWTPEQFKTFNAPTILMAQCDPASAIAVSGDVCKVELWISHFGAEPVSKAPVIWEVSTDAGVMAGGTLALVDASPGDVKSIGVATFTVAELDKPVHAVFRARLENGEVANAWDFWFFPKRAATAAPGIAVTKDLASVLSARYPGVVTAGTPEADSATVVIGSWDHPDLLNAVRTGKRGIMIGPADGDPNVSLGWWSLGEQVGTAFAQHPVFGQFPHDGKLSPLWFRLLKHGLPLPIDPKYGAFTYFAVGEGREAYYAYVFQRHVEGEGDVLMTRGLDLLADKPEGAYLLDAMVDYVRGAAFVAGAMGK